MGKEENRSVSIDFIKAICIILIITTHYARISDGQRHILFWPITVDIAVPVFMIISGYNYSKSIQSKNIFGYFNWFEKQNILPKLSRIAIPFICAFIIQAFYMYSIGSEFNLVGFAHNFLSGGVGPGSYYTPVMIQLLFLFPLLYFPFKNNSQKAAMAIILLNIAFEAIVAVLNLSQPIYRLCVLRYISFILFGMVLSKYKDRLKNNLLPLFCIFSGIVYLLFINYFNYDFRLVASWKNTSLFVAPYAFGLVYYLMRLFDKIKGQNLIVKSIMQIGKSSYHIFLVQMLYYSSLYEAQITKNVPMILGLVINLLVCISVGCLFRVAESKIRGLLRSLKYRKSSI